MDADSKEQEQPVVTSGLFTHWCRRKEEEQLTWSPLCGWRYGIWYLMVFGS